MKVLYICSSLERTGPTNQLRNIISNLDNGLDVTLLTLKKEKSNTMIGDFSGKKIICAKDFSLFKLIKFIRGFDIVHSQGIKADIFSSLFAKRSIATLRNYPYEDYPPLYGWFVGNVMAYFHLLILRFVTARVTISSSTRKKNVDKSKLRFELITNGVDVEFYRRKNDIIPQEIIGIDKSKYKKTFIYTGPLIERKNVKEIIDIINDKPEFLLIILGDGPDIENLKSEAKNNILFVGNVNNVVDYLSISDVFIMLSKSEGFPNSVMEALSVGLPCVLSNIPSHKDVSDVMGYGITLVNFGEHDFIDNYNFDVNNCYIINKVNERLSAFNMASKYMDLYKNLYIDANKGF